MTRLRNMTLLVAAIAIGLGVGFTRSGLAAEFNWKMATSWGGGPLMEIGAKAFAKKVKFLTDGRVNIQVFTGGQLGSALKVSETVRNGVAEVGHTWMGYDWGKDMTTVLFGGFAGSMDAVRMIHWLYGGGGLKLWRQFRYEKFGVVSMPMFLRPAEVFLHSRKPVRTLADLKGLKLRTAGAWIEISRSLGASPVTMPGADVYTALARGVIDATEWGTLWENIPPGFNKIAKYLILPGIHQPVAPFEVMFNKAAWNKLSKRDQRLIELAAKQVTYDSWTRIGNEDAKALIYYRKAGNVIIELDRAVQVKAKKLALQWAAKQAKGNPWFTKVWKSQQAFVKLWKNAGLYRINDDSR